MSETKEKEIVKNVTKDVQQEGDFKIKKKPKKFTKKKNTPVKVDMSKTVEKKEETKDAISESGTGNVDETQPTTPVSEVVEEVRELSTEQPTTEEGVIQEITNEVKEKTLPEVTTTQSQSDLNLPENVEKLVEFMKDTGGTLQDYIRLNADYSNVDNYTLLREYYKQNKPHLDLEEIDFLMEDKFAYDEEMDEERDIRKKKLAIKEEVAKAKNFLEDLKGKYYDEIKLRPGVTQEQQKAMDFFNRYNEEQEMRTNQHTEFVTSTENLFSNEFKGFEFNLGEKRFRYGVKNPGEVAKNQSDLNTFVKTFLNEDGTVEDYNAYHKAIYAARNADTIAQHFYEQGKTDAIKNITAQSKNINNEPRAAASGDVFLNGLRVKAISGVDSSKLKIKRKTNN